MGYGVWLHGEAVAAGTMMAADLSRRMDHLNDAEVARIERLFRAANLPTHAPDLGVDAYLDLMGLDKKVSNGKIRFILLQAIGTAVMTGDYPPAELRATLALT